MTEHAQPRLDASGYIEPFLRTSARYLGVPYPEDAPAARRLHCGGGLLRARAASAEAPPQGAASAAAMSQRLRAAVS
jgi:hypothetical protein